TVLKSGTKRGAETGPGASAISSIDPKANHNAMRLLRYGPAGHEQPGLLDSHGRIRSLAGSIPDLTPPHLSPAGLARLAALDPASLPVAPGNPRLGVPVAGTRKFLAIGLNYAEHATESNLPLPAEPVVFTKAVTCLQGPNDDVMIPKGSKKTDWEVELGVVIGSTARYVEEGAALECVAGYLVVNDISEREYQIERGGTWDKGKGCDTFGPIGPWLVTADEIPDPQRLALWLEVDGKRYQNGNTSTMIFNVAQIVSYLSRFMSLQPGDVISTGTPPGVGMGQKPMPLYLKAGQTMRLGIEGLGEQRQTTVQA